MISWTGASKSKPVRPETVAALGARHARSATCPSIRAGWAASAAVRDGFVTSADPFSTVKNRLPMPSFRFWLSMTPHAIV